MHCEKQKNTHTKQNKTKRKTVYSFVRQTFTKCLLHAWQRAMNTMGTLQPPGKILSLEDKGNLGVPEYQKGHRVVSSQPRDSPG